ncbi:MAG: hypothetical protein RLZZ175_3360 [Bacteroidota bacterium]|jgi:hypothetical protein
MNEQFKSAFKMILQILTPVVMIVLYHEHNNATQDKELALLDLRVTNLENEIKPKMKFEPFSNNSNSTDTAKRFFNNILGYYDERKKLNTPISNQKLS